MSQCPTPLRHDTIQLAHGGGGRLQQALLDAILLPQLGNPILAAQHDAAVLSVEGARLALSTDSFVVTPRFFPGGDLGELAVYGTVNDLACAGARPVALSCGLILEEGLPIAELTQLVASLRAAADRVGVSVVTGDTKVVDRGRGDGLYINTTGLGVVSPGCDLRPSRIASGDVVLVSGDLGRHGAAIMSVRRGLGFDAALQSDCAPVWSLAAALLEAQLDVHCLRDPTRGGLAAVLCELSTTAERGITIEESALPVHPEVAAVCELLGLDPLYVACEGRLVAFVKEDEAERALAIWRALPEGKDAQRVGRVVDVHRGQVVLRTRYGTKRLVDLPSGEQLPRIC